MATTPFAQKLSDARLLSDAVKAHEAELLKVGLEEKTAESLKECVDELSRLDTEQEKLKAELKVTTAKMADVLKVLDGVMTDSRKRVKLAFKSEQWKEFGIAATR